MFIVTEITKLQNEINTMEGAETYNGTLYWELNKRLKALEELQERVITHPDNTKGVMKYYYDIILPELEAEIKNRYEEEDLFE